jgi:2-aminobenzoylacetyl-CoA thioesterase
MRSQTPGKICDGLWYLGRAESGVYLIAGRDESMIISGGMSYIAPSVMRQLQEFGLKEDRISSMLILHAHFDHIGIVPFFRQRHPDIRVYASRRAWQILAEPRNILTINEFSRRVTEHMGSADAGCELDWPQGLLGESVYEGTTINLGGIEVQIMETPGHSSCSITAYVPQLRALFPSDGGGIPYKETIVAAPNSNFTQYKDSLKKMEPLTVKYLCADHFGYVSGDEAGSYLARSIQSAEQEYTRLATIYHRLQDIEIAAKEAASSFLAQNPDYFLSPDIYEGICRQMMKQIAKGTGGGSR